MFPEIIYGNFSQAFRVPFVRPNLLARAQALHNRQDGRRTTDGWSFTIPASPIKPLQFSGGMNKHKATAISSRRLQRTCPCLVRSFCCLLPAPPRPTLPPVDWPQFRGVTGQGHAEAAGLPLTWSETENIVWKTPLEGLGWSSPAIAQGPALAHYGRRGRQVAAGTCAWIRRAASSFTTWRSSAWTIPARSISKNSHASPTPLVEDGRVYVHFGAHGTACVSTDGKVLWKTQELKYNHRHGPGGSPVLYEDLLILSCDGTDVAFVVALDKQTGQIRWKTPREGPMAYSTPLIIKVGGRDQVVSTGGDQVVSYEPLTGKEIWRSRYDGYSGVPRPVFGHGLVFICSGYNTPHLFAIRPDGTGDVTETHVAWSIKAEGARR